MDEFFACIWNLPRKSTWVSNLIYSQMYSCLLWSPYSHRFSTIKTRRLLMCQWIKIQDKNLCHLSTFATSPSVDSRHFTIFHIYTVYKQFRTTQILLKLQILLRRYFNSMQLWHNSNVSTLITHYWRTWRFWYNCFYLFLVVLLK